MKKKLPYIAITILLMLASYIFGRNQLIPVNNNQIPVIKNQLCSRTIPYSNPPEFTRAISLINQRFLALKLQPGIDEGVINCLDIQYTNASQDGMEGYFLFDPSSSTEDLKIFVDKSYQNYDDILTAILLAHELRHVQQFLDYKTNGTIISCMDKEVQAFLSEFALVADLNAEERKSLYNRISVNPNLNSAYTGAWQLIQIYNSNQGKSVKEPITNMVYDSDFYKKECNF